MWMKCLVFGTLLVAGPLSFAQTADVPGWLMKDFADLTEGFEGRWDNDRHVFFAEDAGVDPETLAPRQHITVQRVPSVGEANEPSHTALFKAVREVEGEAPASLLHRFDIDVSRKTIRQTMFAVGEAGSGDAFSCHVHWRRSGSQFSGRAEGDGCADLFPRPTEGGALDVEMTLSEQEFWVVSRRGASHIEARMRKARPFECWVAVLRGAEHGDSGAGMSDWTFQRGVKLHDQGGVAVVDTDEAPPRKIRLRLRDVDWTYGTNRPSLTLYVMEGESDRAVSYAWGEAGAARIGINLRWLQASCTHAPASQ